MAAAAAAASLLTYTFIRNPNPNPNPNFSRCGARSPFSVLSRLSLSSQSQFDALSIRRHDLSRGFLTFGRRFGSIVAAYDESTHKDIEVEKDKDELKTEANEAQEAWKETLETFKEEALKMKAISQEAYEVYSKKAMIVLKETSETLKIQAEKAKQDLSVVVKQISEEGKIYLSTAAENSPDSVKDVVETFATSTDELKEMSEVRDFYLGIPYGALLSIGGFLWFMLTGSVSSIRFGVILGSALVALSVASLRAWKRGESSELYLKGQTAIATIIFIREWQLFCQKRLFSTSLMTLISGAMVAFYVYRILIDGSSKSPRSEQS